MNEASQKSTILLEHGTGVGEGAISYKEQMSSLERVDQAEYKVVLHETITSGACIVAIERNVTDDGCIDGRPADSVFSRIPESEEVRKYKESLNRPKVAGGGFVMAGEAYRAILGCAGNSLFDDRKAALAIIDKEDAERRARGEAGFSAGAHTGAHQHGENCDCGAIDKSPLILGNEVKYSAEHEPLIQAMMGDKYSPELAANTLAANGSDKEAYFAGHSGAATIDTLMQNGSIVKLLAGDHKELFIYVNTTPGTTFDQQKYTQIVRSKMIELELQPGGVLEGASEEAIADFANTLNPQVFVIDEWRMREYANVFADHLTRENPEVRLDIEARRETNEYQIAFKKALHSMWAYTFATAATLTDGTLPVYATAA